MSKKPTMTMKQIAAASLLLMLAATPVQAACTDTLHEGRSYTLCDVAADDDLRLFHLDGQGQPFGSFARIDAALAAEGAELVWAMNAGMFHPDRRPVGLYVEGGVQSARLVSRAGPGNFGMLPNGVLCIGAGRVDVIETMRFTDAAPECRYATQSGPMLVIDGALHPRFLVDSPSRTVRNGVGTSADGARAVFAISNQPVTFHEFARLFRDALGLPQALYLDGALSRLHAPGLQRSDWGRPMGPVVGQVAPRAGG
jgi:uncharacterized protein YigE (DUF2233 family)